MTMLRSVATPDSSNSEAGLRIDQPLESCAAYFPPGADVRLYLYVADTLAQDTAQLVEATITGPDGEIYAVEDVGMTIPDADPDGVVTFFAPA